MADTAAAPSWLLGGVSISSIANNEFRSSADDKLMGVRGVAGVAGGVPKSASNSSPIPLDDDLGVGKLGTAPAAVLAVALVGVTLPLAEAPGVSVSPAPVPGVVDKETSLRRSKSFEPVEVGAPLAVSEDGAPGVEVPKENRSSKSSSSSAMVRYADNPASCPFSRPFITAAHLPRYLPTNGLC